MHLCCAANFMFAASLRSLKTLRSLTNYYAASPHPPATAATQRNVLYCNTVPYRSLHRPRLRRIPVDALQMCHETPVGEQSYPRFGYSWGMDCLRHSFRHNDIKKIADDYTRLLFLHFPNKKSYHLPRRTPNFTYPQLAVPYLTRPLYPMPNEKRFTSIPAPT